MRRSLLTVLLLPMLGLLGLVAMVARWSDRPLRTRRHAGADPDQLMVVIPGLGANGWMLHRQGIIQAIRAGGFEGDVLTADIGLLDFVQHRVLERLDAEVLGPHRGRYRQVRVLGISMGAMAALMAAARFGDELTSVTVLSPWLGPPGTASAIARAGGIDGWRPPASPRWQDRVWAWWQRHEAMPRVWLGYGTADRVNGVPTLLLDRLPASRVRTVVGGHAWAVWRTLTTRLVAAELAAARDGRPALTERLEPMAVP